MNSIGEYRNVSVGGVPYQMSIIEGGVLFSNKSGFYGVSGRYVFSYRSGLWYLDDIESTFGTVPCTHVTKMHKHLSEYIAKDHAESTFELSFKKS